MIVHNDVEHDSRVLKEAAGVARHGWRVVVIGMALRSGTPLRMEHPAGFTIVSVKPPFVGYKSSNRLGLLIRLLLSLPMLMFYLRRVNARVYHANDFTGLLQVAMTGIWRRPVIYDSHELFFDRPLPDLPGPIRWLVARMRSLEQLLARRAVAVITVNDMIADRLADTLRIPRPFVVRNAVDLRVNAPCAAVYPKEEGRKLIAHSGRFIAARHLPELVQALCYLPEDTALVLMGEGPLKTQLLALAQQYGVSERLFFVPPVPPESVAATLAQADVGVVLTSTDGLNNRYALPNKFFEAVAAGLPVVTGPNEEIAARVRQFEIGAVCDPNDSHSIAKAIQNVLSPEHYGRFHQNAVRARQILTWENEEKILIQVYEQVFSKL
jgi:glycosyltransferase involved in cell wall biosynthesis